MPSATITPVQLIWTVPDLSTSVTIAHIQAVRLIWAGGNITTSTSAPLASVSRDVELPRLERQTSYWDAQGRPTMQMQLFWQRMAQTIEAAFSDQGAAITDLEAIVTRLDSNESNIQVVGDDVAALSSNQAVVGSFTNNPINPLTASNAGTITIAAHERVYDTLPTKVTVSVDGGSLVGLTAGSTYNVFYDDAARVGGAVAYIATQNAVIQGGSVHVVGIIAIPTAGEVDAAGTPIRAQGSIAPEFYDIYLWDGY